MPATLKACHGLAAARGWTITECCACMAIAALLAVAAAPAFTETLQRRHLEGRAAELAAHLHQVRTEAVLRNRTLRITISDDARGSCYVIQSGTEGRCRCAGNDAVRCDDGAHAVKHVFLPADGSVRLAARASSMVYDPARGTVSPANTLTVYDARGHEISHKVNVTGRVNSCASVRGLGGHRAC